MEPVSPKLAHPEDQEVVLARQVGARMPPKNERESILVSHAKPAYTPAEVNRAARIVSDYITGDFFLENPNLPQSLVVVDNWRSAHTYPLNAIHMTLRNRARSIQPSGVVTAQRTKRLQSIVSKLIDRPEMKLTQMQDIAGCRVVLDHLPAVRELQRIYETLPTKHMFTGAKDYIDSPRASGYRSLHLKYRFHGTGKTKDWNDLKVEIQIRTQLQHRWATAVEAAGTFTKQALKSSKGEQDLLRFFALMSSVFAIREGTTPVPGTPDNMTEITEELRRINKSTHIVSTLNSYADIIPDINRSSKSSFYYLIELDPTRRSVEVETFARGQSQQASAKYTQKEAKLKDTAIQVVLVSVSSVEALKRAYPNYFLDTKLFAADVISVIEGKFP